MKIRESKKINPIGDQKHKGEAEERGLKYFEKVLESSIQEIRSTQNGARHDVVNRSAFKVGTVSHLSLNSLEAIEQRLIEALPSCVSHKQHEHTIRNALRDGATKPRGLHFDSMPYIQPFRSQQMKAPPNNSLDELPPCVEWQSALNEFVATCANALPHEVRESLHMRGICDEIIEQYSIGYNIKSHKVAGKWWAERGITIPRRISDTLWAVNVRRSQEDMDRYNRGKYINVAGSKLGLFNANAIQSKTQCILLCAGEFDALLAQRFAPANLACVTFGTETKAPSVRWQIAIQHKQLLIAFDNDKAGDTGAQKWIKLGRRIHVPYGKDITEFWQAGFDVGTWLSTLTNAPIISDANDDAKIRTLELLGFENVSYTAEGRLAYSKN